MWMLLRHEAPVEEKDKTLSPSAEYRQVKHANHEPSIPAFRAGDPGSNPGRSTILKLRELRLGFVIF